MLIEIETTIGDTSSFNKADEDAEAKPSTQQGSQFTVYRTNSFIRAHDLNLASDNGNLRRSKNGLVSVDGSETSSIINALVSIGLHEATDESSRWSAISSTEYTLRNRAKQQIRSSGMGSWKNATCGDEVFVWSSNCTRPGYGSDYPVVKSRGIIPASASDVVDLLRDSNRVTSYNKMSIGREDQHVLTHHESSVHRTSKCPQLGVAGEAKIMSSKSQPPFVRKPLEFKTLFHARQLDHNDGVECDGGISYITVGRSVWETPEGTSDGSDTTTTRCEILLSINLIREVVGPNGEKWCEITCITHAISPGGVPLFIGRKLGLVAAENYIKDIRALFQK